MSLSPSQIKALEEKRDYNRLMTHRRHARVRKLLQTFVGVDWFVKEVESLLREREARYEL